MLAGFGELLLALALFLVSHRVPARPAVRRRLVAGLGERGYLAAYSLLSLVLLAWLVSAVLRAPYVGLWPRADWALWLPLLLMAPACLLLVAGLTSANPFSVGSRRRSFDPDRPGIVSLTRHPVLWGFVLWAGAHLPANGHLAAALLFGLTVLFGLVGMVALDRRARRRLGAADFARLATGTALLPLAAQLRGRAIDWRGIGLGRLLGGIGLFMALLGLHAPLLGRVPLPPAMM